MKHLRKRPPIEWIKRYLGRVENWEGGAPSSWDEAAVNSWIEDLEPWQWQKLRAAWRSMNYRRASATKRQLDRGAKLGLLDANPGVDVFYENYKQASKNWQAFLTIVPKEVRGTMELLHMRDPDTPPWQAVSQMLGVGMQMREPQMDAVLQKVNGADT